MKGDVYYLKNEKDGEILAKFEQGANGSYLDGSCYECISWDASTGEPFDWEFFANVYCKWDGCTHWYFNGTDYDPEVGESSDSYYHLCGSHSFTHFIRIMCFLWKLAPMVIIENRENEHTYCDKEYLKEYTNDAYTEGPITQQLIDMMLDGCIIEKVEVKKSE